MPSRATPSRATPGHELKPCRAGPFRSPRGQTVPYGAKTCLDVSLPRQAGPNPTSPSLATVWTEIPYTEIDKYTQKGYPG